MTLDLAEEYRMAHFFDVRRAYLAREHFARVGPPELQPLPLSHSEISDRKYNWAVGASAEFRALAFISSRFAASLRADDDWDYKEHPPFDDYVRGVLASKHPDLDHLSTRRKRATCILILSRYTKNTRRAHYLGSTASGFGSRRPALNVPLKIDQDLTEETVNAQACLKSEARL